MVESHQDNHEAQVAPTEQELADKRASTNWADDNDGGDDDETEIGGSEVPQIPQVEEKKVFKIPPKRERNANGDFVVSTIKIKELEARPKEVELNQEEESEESEESEKEQEKPEEEVKKVEQPKQLSKKEQKKREREEAEKIFAQLSAGSQPVPEETKEENKEGKVETQAEIDLKKRKANQKKKEKKKQIAEEAKKAQEQPAKELTEDEKKAAIAEAIAKRAAKAQAGKAQNADVVQTALQEQANRKKKGSKKSGLAAGYDR